MENLGHNNNYKTDSSKFPDTLSDAEIIYWVQSKNINWKYLEYLKQFSGLKDDTLSRWLNISVKTFRSYKKTALRLKENLQEHVLQLITLYKHGILVFDSVKAFNAWLYEDNFFFDGKAPYTFLNTISGIQFVKDNLTAIEYGDNV